MLHVLGHESLFDENEEHTIAVHCIHNLHVFVGVIAVLRIGKSRFDVLSSYHSRQHYSSHMQVYAIQGKTMPDYDKYGMQLHCVFNSWAQHDIETC